MTTQTSLLRLILPVQGEFSGTWGDQVNAGLTNLLDTAIAGTTTLFTDADVTLTTANFATDTSRAMILVCSGARVAPRNILAPNSSKVYLVINATTQAHTLKGVTGPTTGVTIPPSASALCAWNSVSLDFVVVASNNLTTNHLGALPPANGGTGATSNAAAPFALKGANADITSIGGLSTPLSIGQGVTNSTTAGAALTALGAAASGTNTDITALNSTNGVGFGVAPTGGINAAVQTKDGVKFPATAVLSTDANVLDRYVEGSYTGTATGFTANPTGTINYVRIGRQVTLSFPSTFFGTSNATTFTITGGPADITPANFKNVYASLTDVGVVGIGVASVQTDGSITFYKAPGGVAFTASGSKSLNICSITYGLD